MKIETSYGEVLDKYTILQIKLNKLAKNDPRRKYVSKEISSITKDLIEEGRHNFREELSKLRQINEQLWEVQEDQRKLDKIQRWDLNFVNLSRQIFQLNDERAKEKNRINEKYLCPLREIKIY